MLEIGVRLVLAEEGVEATHSTIASSLNPYGETSWNSCSSLDHRASEMVTVEELFQMMNTLQGQHHALSQEISSCTAENQQFSQAGSPGLAKISTIVGQAVETVIPNVNPRSIN